MHHHLRYVTGTLVGQQSDEPAEPAGFLPLENLSGALTRSRQSDSQAVTKPWTRRSRSAPKLRGASQASPGSMVDLGPTVAYLGSSSGVESFAHVDYGLTEARLGLLGTEPASSRPTHDALVTRWSRTR